MANGKSTWKYNKLLTGRRNYFANGSQANTIERIKPLTGMSTPDLSSFIKPVSKPTTLGPMNLKTISTADRLKDFAGSQSGSTAISAGGTIGGKLISGGFETGVGNVLSGLSSIASAIPGWGAVASAGLSLMSGLTNRMFGSKMNTENIAKVEANINDLNNFQSNASDFDTLSQNWANADVGMTFDDSFIGKDGWLSNKAKNKAADLRKQVEAGNAWVQNTLVNNAENISTAQMQNLLGNYAAFGGPLLYSKGGGYGGGYTGGGGASAGGKLTTKYREVADTTYVPRTVMEDFNTAFKRARKAGKKTFKFNGKEYNTNLGNNPNNYEAGRRRLQPVGTVIDTVVDRHRESYVEPDWYSFGGELNTHGGNFTNGLMFIDAGGSHESNPYQGVQLGMDQEGVPNLVEEGETVFNDYVFSRRLKVPNTLKRKYGLGGKKRISFADMSKKLAKESEERPNDPISQNGLMAFMSDLMYAQEFIRQRKETQNSNMFAGGGSLTGLFNTLTYANKSGLNESAFRRYFQDLYKNTDLRALDSAMVEAVKDAIYEIGGKVYDKGTPDDLRDMTERDAEILADRFIRDLSFGADSNLSLGKNYQMATARAIGDIIVQNADALNADEEDKKAIASYYKSDYDALDDKGKASYNPDKMKWINTYYPETSATNSNTQTAKQETAPTNTSSTKPAAPQGIENMAASPVNEAAAPAESTRPVQSNETEKAAKDQASKLVSDDIYSLANGKKINEGDELTQEEYDEIQKIKERSAEHNKAIASYKPSAEANASQSKAASNTTKPSATDTTMAKNNADRAKQDPIDNYYLRTSDNEQFTLMPGENPLLDIMNAGKYAQVRTAPNKSGGTDYYWGPKPVLEVPEALDTRLRYAPAVGLGISAIADAFGINNKPVYDNADLVYNAATRSGYMPVRYRPISNYLTYRPFDRDYYLNKMSAEAGATRRNIMNTSGGNRATAMTGILAADNNFMNQVGGMAKQAEEYNLAQRQTVADFNRATNSANSQGFLSAAASNQEAYTEAMKNRLAGITSAAGLREAERLRIEQAKSENLSNFVTALGAIGEDNASTNQLNFLLASGWTGPIRDELKPLIKAANGGKIKRRKKKGLTV